MIITISRLVQLSTVQDSDIQLHLRHADTTQHYSILLLTRIRNSTQPLKYDSTLTDIPLAHYAEAFNSKTASTEHPTFTPSLKQKKDLSKEDTPPAEKEDVPQLISKRCTTSRTI